MTLPQLAVLVLVVGGASTYLLAQYVLGALTDRAWRIERPWRCRWWL